MSKLVGVPTAAGISLRWELPADNGAAVQSYQVQIWLAGTLGIAPKQQVEPSRPASENGQLSEDGEESMAAAPENAAVSTTSEEAHSETGQKSRRKRITQQLPALQTLICKEPSCQITGLWTIVLLLPTCRLEMTVLIAPDPVAGLEADTEYALKLRSTNAAGASEWSQPFVFRTGPAPPSAPSNLSAEGKRGARSTDDTHCETHVPNCERLSTILQGCQPPKSICNGRLRPKTMALQFARTSLRCAAQAAEERLDHGRHAGVARMRAAR